MPAASAPTAGALSPKPAPAPTHAAQPKAEERPKVAERKDEAYTANGAANGASVKPPVANGNATNGNGAAATGLARSRPKAPQMLNLRIRESDSPVDDQVLLDDVKRLLLDYSGGDPVMLEIAAGGTLYRLEWSTIQVNACDELADRIQEALGESGSASLQAITA